MNLLNLKNRIRSVKNIGQVTKAMELVAATKMRRAQLRSINSRKYAQELGKVISKFDLNNDENTSIWIPRTNAEKNLLILVGPSKGLAGALISNLGRELYNFLIKNPNTEIISIDKKGSYLAERSGKKIVAAMPIVKTNIQQNELDPIFLFIKEKYTLAEYKSVHIIYTKFINTILQKPSTEQILPILIDSSDEKFSSNEILIEPNKSIVIETIMQKYFENKIYVSVLESIASEFSARMIAMKNASDNSQELRDDLTMEYNQSRQAAITQQILEIAGAQAAMEE